MALPVRRSSEGNGGSAAQQLERWNPIREFEQLQEEMGRLIQSAWSPAAGDGGSWIPFADVEETESAWIIEAELPGVSRDDINVELRNGELVISGDVKEREGRGRLRRRARRTGHFEYHVTLPGEIDEEHIDATLNEGVVTVRAPKTEQAKARRIEVRAGEQ
jgi:HSP20 family protein